MHKSLSLVIAVAALLIAPFELGAVQPNKCVVNGKTTYQQDACPTGQRRDPPTVQELNAQEKKRRAAAPVLTERVPSTMPAVASSFRCDARKYCSQMTSCEEAKYFLARCPGVKMDGDGDGIPCEEQWCRR